MAGTERRSSRIPVGWIFLIVLGVASALLAWRLTNQPALPQPSPVAAQSTPTMVANHLPAACIVSNVSGQDQTAAEQLLNGLGLKVIRKTAFNTDIPAGIVIDQEPAAGKQLDPCQGQVILTISQGIPPKPTSTPPLPTLTPVPPTATPALTPVPPTATPAPTFTRTPAPTPTVAETRPGSVLQVGQTWKQGDLELSLTRSKLVTLGGWNGSGIIISYRLTNRRAQDVVLRYSQENFTATDNRGGRLPIILIQNCCTYNQNIPVISVVLGSGQSINPAAAGGLITDDMYIQADIGDPAMTEVIVTVSGISSINTARWRIPIPH